MKTKSLLKLSLIVALIGTFVIIILANNLEPKVRKIETINEKSLDEWVKIQGTIVQDYTKENLKIITVNDGTASINCILRKKSDSFNENLKGKRVEILGKVIEYKDEIEIEINSLKTT